MYYVLFQKHGGFWSPEFGDYERSIVEEEKQEARFPSKIVSLEDASQEAIAAHTSKLNGGSYV